MLYYEVKSNLVLSIKTQHCLYLYYLNIRIHFSNSHIHLLSLSIESSMNISVSIILAIDLPYDVLGCVRHAGMR